MLEYVCSNFHVICFLALALLIICKIGGSVHSECRAVAKQSAAEQAERERAAAKAYAKRQAEEQRAAAELERQRKRNEREAAQEQRHAAKVAKARELAELKERALDAEKELRALKAQPVTLAEPVQDADKSSGDEIQAMEPDEFAAFVAQLDAPKLFAGHVVAFTGTLYDDAGKRIVRKDAVAMVRSLGGKAYEKAMPAGTTLLVVGERPGNDKLDKADEWISQLTKITPKRFFDMARGAA